MLAHSNAATSASYPAPFSATAAAAAATGDQQNWLWKYRLSASRLFFSTYFLVV
jgi:hypothetical protein